EPTIRNSRCICFTTKFIMLLAFSQCPTCDPLWYSPKNNRAAHSRQYTQQISFLCLCRTENHVSLLEPKRTSSIDILHDSELRCEPWAEVGRALPFMLHPGNGL